MLSADGASFLQAEGIDVEAAEYLRAVREEASKIPHITASKGRAPPRDASRSASTADASTEVPEQPKLPPPLIEWTYGVIHGFMEARSQVQYAV